MWTTVAARRALVLGRAAGPMRRTVRFLPRALFLRNGGAAVANAMRPLTVSALMRAAAAATAKKTKPKASATKKKTTAAKKKPAAKAKAKKPAKKKKVAKKVVKKKKTATTKKPLTEEQKARREIIFLKKLALLNLPTQKPSSAWSLHLAQNIRKGEGKITLQVSELAASFKELSEDHRDDLESTAAANKISNERMIQNWINSHPPEAIYEANKARRRLAKRLGKRSSHLIHDDRLPSRPANAYAVFCRNNYSKADDEANSEAFKRLGARWKSMGEDQRAPYQRQAAADGEKSAAALKTLREKGKHYVKSMKKAAVAK